MRRSFGDGFIAKNVDYNVISISEDETRAYRDSISRTVADGHSQSRADAFTL